MSSWYMMKSIALIADPWNNPILPIDGFPYLFLVLAQVWCFYVLYGCVLPFRLVVLSCIMFPRVVFYLLCQRLLLGPFELCAGSVCLCWDVILVLPLHLPLKGLICIRIVARAWLCVVSWIVFLLVAATIFRILFAPRRSVGMMRSRLFLLFLYVRYYPFYPVFR